MAGQARHATRRFVQLAEGGLSSHVLAKAGIAGQVYPNLLSHCTDYLSFSTLYNRAHAFIKFSIGDDLPGIDRYNNRLSSALDTFPDIRSAVWTEDSLGSTVASVIPWLLCSPAIKPLVMSANASRNLSAQ